MTQVEEIALAVNPYGTAMRTVTINVNDRCPLKCRHCSVGFSNTHRGTDQRINAEDLRHTIAAVESSVYDMVLLAGGEPTLNPELLQVAIAACRANGLLSAIVTAPIWASNSASATRFLKKLAGLDVLILSYDRYHLEFLRLSHYEKAVRAAAERNIFIQMEIVFTEESERKCLVDEIAHLAHLLNIHATRAVPIGNAADPIALPMHRVTIQEVADLTQVPRSCALGNVHIDERATVHGCCWSRVASPSPFSIIGGRERLHVSLEALEQDSRFQAMREYGFIDGLNEAGQQALAGSVAGRSFANECDLCIAAMDSGDDKIWEQYRAPSWAVSGS